MTASRGLRAQAEDDDGRSGYAALSDRALVDAMRELDAEAIVEFIDRFQHVVLIQARRLRIPRAERQGWTSDLLYDVARSLCRRGPAAPPRALTAYLITACKRKAFASTRQRLVRERLESEHAEEAAGYGDRAVLASCSEHTVRSAHGAEWEATPLPTVLERLVSVFDEGITGDERELLSWVAQHISYSEIAEWVGDKRNAVVKRVTRLRARLIDATIRYGDNLQREERQELLRFLRRSGAFTEKDLEPLVRHDARRDHTKTPTKEERPDARQ